MPPASKKNLVLKAESQSENLLTKEQGQHIYGRVRDELKGLPCPGLLVLDFLGMQHITLTCLRQILKFFYERDREEWANKCLLIRLQDANSDIKACLSLVAKEEALALLCCDAVGNWEILGKLTHALNITLEVVQQLGRATSEQVSQKLGLSLSAASNRLRQLYEMGLVIREEGSLPITGGRRFVYAFVLSYPFRE